MSPDHSSEVKSGERFQFGENWNRFLSVVDEDRIREAEATLRQMLDVESLTDKVFLDIGSGSGLFSLAARRLGAKVYSFDYDPASVACTREMKRRYREGDVDWRIDEGSVLDADYVKGLGQFDIVYSWGVLHHTGNMVEAFANAANALRPGGALFIAIYNDQGVISRYWTLVKKLFNRVPLSRPFLILLHAPYLLLLRFAVRLLLGRLQLERGMSMWHDMLDWLGGYPFEVAKPEVVLEFFLPRGLELKKLRTCAGRMGCNEYVFR
ncbi:MAG: class I SAM-dependent methyltransferase [Polaromonas sp.]|nr:class I SAM-dependent methyltransferase [Polaromonas sp.]